MSVLFAFSFFTDRTPELRRGRIRLTRHPTAGRGCPAVPPAQPRPWGWARWPGRVGSDGAGLQTPQPEREAGEQSSKGGFPALNSTKQTPSGSNGRIAAPLGRSPPRTRTGQEGRGAPRATAWPFRQLYCTSPSTDTPQLHPHPGILSRWAHSDSTRCPSREPAPLCPGWRVALRLLRPSWSVQCPGGPASSPRPPTRRPTSRTGGCRISPPASRLWTPWGEAPGGGAVPELVGSALCGPNSFIFFLIYNFFGGIADLQCCVQQSEPVVRIRISALF